jgi:hypothetical protein
MTKVISVHSIAGEASCGLLSKKSAVKALDYSGGTGSLRPVTSVWIECRLICFPFRSACVCSH